MSVKLRKLVGDFAVTPARAQTIDSKIDDGNPISGNVYAAFMSRGDNRLHPESNPFLPMNCLTNTWPLPQYNTTYGSLACSLG